MKTIMQAFLSQKLYEYIVRNNPDLIISLSDKGGISQYIRTKVKTAESVWENLQAEGCPRYIMEELCMDMLTEDLKPSRFHYLCSLLDAEFETNYQRLQEAGILTLEVSVLIERCQSLFEHFDFREGNEDNRQLYHAITGMVKAYFDELKNPEQYGL